MPTPTYLPIATTTLASNTYAVSWSSLPQGYRDLVIVFSGRCDTNSVDLQIVVNNDGSYSYYECFMTDGPFSGGDEGNYFKVGHGNWLNASQSNFVCAINDYSQTDKQKHILVRYGQGGSKVGMTIGRYNSTNAVTALTLRTGYNGAGWLMAAGSVISIYGIAG